MEYAYQNSTIAQILEAIINESTFEGESNSNIGDILLSILNKTPYTEPPKSVIADLLLRVKAKIEGESFEPYEGDHISRIADILISILNETEYDQEPQSRIAELLLELKEELEAYTELTASGSIASFTTNTVKPLVNGEFSIQAYQEGSGDPSPVNVRNIVGFDKLRIDMVNWNNLYDFTENSTRWKINGSVTRTWSDGALTISNGNTNSAYAYQEFQETSGHKMLYICEGQSVDPVARGCALSFYVIGATTDITKYFLTTRTVLSGIFASETTIINRMQFRPNNTQSKVIVYKSILVDITQAFGARIADYLYTLEQAQEGAGVAIFKQLFYKDYYDYNVGGTWVSVASVNGDNYPDYAEINLGEDVYGGSYNSDTGVLSVTSEALKIGDIEWIYSGGYFRTKNVVPNMVKSSSNLTVYPLLCSVFSPKSWTDCVSGNYNYTMAIGWLNQNYIAVFDSDYSSTNDFVNAFENTYIYYPLETPFEIQLEPTPINTFNGDNNIFCDTGDTSVTYLYKGTPPETLTRSSKAGDNNDIIKEIEEIKTEDEKPINEEVNENEK